MKSVFIAGSRKFYTEIESFLEKCKNNKVNASTAGKWAGEKDTFDSEKNALFSAFERIDKSGILYVFARDGFIGKTVALEIAYAFAKGKEIISSEEIKDFSARTLVSKVMSPEEFVENAKRY